MIFQMAKMKQKIAILGITGTVGSKALSIIMNSPELFDVEFITAYENQIALNDAAIKLKAKKAILTKNNIPALIDIINNSELDRVVVAASGVDILPAVMALSGKKIVIAMANKECIVIAGEFIQKELEKSGGILIPVDSEHSAIYQCLNGENVKSIKKIILTASGGPFRKFTKEHMHSVTKSQALKHPNWNMGAKITIDSSTMMNKGLEIIEAKVLFKLNPNQVSAIIHPESIVHGMVEFNDGSIGAQLAAPDMSLPISYALHFPERRKLFIQSLDFAEIASLSFENIDEGKFACFGLARKVLLRDSISERIILSTANEIAVQLFLNDKISYNEIYPTINNYLEKLSFSEPKSINEVIEIISEVKSFNCQYQ